MNETWRRITKDPKELEYLHSVFSNKFFSESVGKMLEILLDEEESKETSTSQYKDPSWAYAQADRNGAKRMVRKLSALFNASNKLRS